MSDKTIATVMLISLSIILCFTFLNWSSGITEVKMEEIDKDLDEFKIIADNGTYTLPPEPDPDPDPEPEPEPEPGPIYLVEITVTQDDFDVSILLPLEGDHVTFYLDYLALPSVLGDTWVVADGEFFEDLSFEVYEGTYQIWAEVFTIPEPTGRYDSFEIEVPT